MTKKHEYIKQRDQRDCPKCGTRMELKGATTDGDNDLVNLWQCSNCKNVELNYKT